jgi:hypothetical protein
MPVAPNHHAHTEGTRTDRMISYLAGKGMLSVRFIFVGARPLSKKRRLDRALSVGTNIARKSNVSILRQAVSATAHTEACT